MLRKQFCIFVCYVDGYFDHGAFFCFVGTGRKVEFCGVFGACSDSSESGSGVVDSGQVLLGVTCIGCSVGSWSVCIGSDGEDRGQGRVCV